MKLHYHAKELKAIVTQALNDAMGHGKQIGTFHMSRLGNKYAPLTEEAYRIKWFKDNLP